MNRTAVSAAIAAIAGVAFVYLLPLPWLAPLSTVTAIFCAIFAIIVRLSTTTEPPSNPMASILLSVANLPEQPLAKVKAGWPLTAFLTSATLLISLGLSIMVRANA